MNFEIRLKLLFARQLFEIAMRSHDTIGELKSRIFTITGIQPHRQRFYNLPEAENNRCDNLKLEDLELDTNFVLELKDLKSEQLQDNSETTVDYNSSPPPLWGQNSNVSNTDYRAFTQRRESGDQFWPDRNRTPALGHEGLRSAPSNCSNSLLSPRKQYINYRPVPYHCGVGEDQSMPIVDYRNIQQSSRNNSNVDNRLVSNAGRVVTGYSESSQNVGRTTTHSNDTLSNTNKGLHHNGESGDQPVPASRELTLKSRNIKFEFLPTARNIPPSLYKYLPTTRGVVSGFSDPLPRVSKIVLSGAHQNSDRDQSSSASRTHLIVTVEEEK